MFFLIPVNLNRLVKMKSFGVFNETNNGKGWKGEGESEKDCE